MKRILLATDGSSSADRALEFAAHMAARFHAELSIVTVLSATDLQDLEAFGHAEQSALGDILEGERHKILAVARAKAASLGATQIGTIAKHGDPATVILELARELSASEIVVGRRGRGRLEGLLLGSVSQKIITLSPCPVVVVP